MSNTSATSQFVCQIDAVTQENQSPSGHDAQIIEPTRLTAAVTIFDHSGQPLGAASLLRIEQDRASEM
jgi:hypothetical protein